jgi:hypothetical protein
LYPIFSNFDSCSGFVRQTARNRGEGPDLRFEFAPWSRHSPCALPQTASLFTHDAFEPQGPRGSRQQSLFRLPGLRAHRLGLEGAVPHLQIGFGAFLEGLKAHLELRDGPFQPEPMGLRSAKGRAARAAKSKKD